MTIPEVDLPNLAPPSPALSARSDTSSRLGVGVFNKIASIGRRSSKQPLLPTTNEPSSRPSSPLIGPSYTSDELSEAEEDDASGRRSRDSSMPGSFEEQGGFFLDQAFWQARLKSNGNLEDGRRREESEETEDNDRKGEVESFDDDAIFDDDILATGEMKNVPF